LNYEDLIDWVLAAVVTVAVLGLIAAIIVAVLP
jgi:hypothetical protein